MKAHQRPSYKGKKEFFAIGKFCNEEPQSNRTLYRPFSDAEAFPRIARMKRDPLQNKRFIRDGDVTTLFILDSGTQNFLNENVIPKVCTLLDPEKYPEFVELI